MVPSLISPGGLTGRLGLGPTKKWPILRLGQGSTYDRPRDYLESCCSALTARCA